MFNIISVKSQWTGTVYILANGDVSPPDAPIETSDKITYTLTEDITSNGVGIEVRRSNIIINGNGYILQGAGIGDGFYLYDVSNVTVTNVNIKNFYYGIYLPPSSNNTKIFGNNITENIDSGIYDSSSNNCIRWNNIIRNKGTGISTCDSSKNEIYENNITDNNFYGIYLYSSLSSDIYGNNITNNDDGGIVLDHFSNNNSITNNAIIENNYYGIALSYSSNNNSISDNTFVNCGLLVSDSYQNIIENNTVNDKPLIYLEGVSNYIVSDAGQVILVRCDNILV
jgi:parallel beta-helix repeat protein